jgi:hypothetical protein
VAVQLGGGGDVGQRSQLSIAHRSRDGADALAWWRWGELMMASLITRRAQRTPHLFSDDDRASGEGYVWRRRQGRVVLKLCLVLVCALVILAVVLVAPVTSGSVPT